MSIIYLEPLFWRTYIYTTTHIFPLRVVYVVPPPTKKPSSFPLLNANHVVELVTQKTFIASITPQFFFLTSDRLFTRLLCFLGERPEEEETGFFSFLIRCMKKLLISKALLFHRVNSSPSQIESSRGVSFLKHCLRNVRGKKITKLSNSLLPSSTADIRQNSAAAAGAPRHGNISVETFFLKNFGCCA